MRSLHQNMIRASRKMPMTATTPARNGDAFGMALASNLVTTSTAGGITSTSAGISL